MSEIKQKDILFLMNFPQSVAGVLFSLDRSSILLILRRDVPVWVLPGGGVDPGESAEDAVVREILEETGFTVKANRWIGDYFPINRLAKETRLYECTLLSGEVRLNSEETRGVRFFPIDQLPPLPPPYFEWIQDTLADLPPVKKKLTSVNYRTLIKLFFTHPLLVIRFILSRTPFRINSK